MAKNIVLCSDGTGNKGGAGNDTNVYKLYQAIDIHHDSTQQISFYDNGVGTQVDGSAVKSNKIWVALSGAFGLGFNDKIRDLYEFLARHYLAGDNIYIFGFSRGAATVRAFTGFIHHCGLLDIKGKSEAEFQQLINQAMAAYRLIKTHPEIAAEFKKTYAISGAGYAPDANLEIQFIGVWDTVSALGFPDGHWKTSDPFFKLLDILGGQLEKWSDKKWPHQFYDYALHDQVLYACQALAIDDERKTFHPKTWNEIPRAADSIEQVWFAGAHSNIGGGYHRSGLSNVALEWVFKKAEAKGLLFINDDVSAAAAHANVQGKLYNSRDGLGVYYRYEPRDIEQLCISESRQVPKIAEGKIKIHDSVIDRVKQGTALYAPNYLPAEFEVISSHSSNSTKVSFDKDEWQECRDKTDQWVKKLQGSYRIFIEITLIVLAAIVFFWLCPPDSVKDFLLQEANQNNAACEAFKDIAARCIPDKINLFPPQDWLYSLLVYIFPAIFKNYLVYIICIQPILLIIMLGILVTLLWRNNSHKKNLSIATAHSRQLQIKTFKDL